MGAWVRPVRRGWVVRDEVPGPDVDEFAEPERVVAALAEGQAARRTLLAVQHPHRTPDARAAGLGLTDALPIARSVLSVLLRTAYRPVEDVVAAYAVDGPDGSATGLLCLVDPAAVGPGGRRRVRHTEEVYPDVVAERAEVLAGLGSLTSAALLVPVTDTDRLTPTVRDVIDGAGPAAVSTVDSGGRRHRLWLLGPGPDREHLLALAASAPLLVADGNHRVAAAATAGLDGMLALVTAGPDLRIGAFHRVLTGTGLDAGALTTSWHRAGLEIRDASVDAVPVPGQVLVRCPGGTFVVELPPPDAGQPVPRIDHAVVENLLLDKVLGIDPEGPRVRPLPAGRQPSTSVDAVLELAPVPLADVLAVHRAGLRMPRKSTFFTPKPRSGLLLAELPPRGLHSTND
ncbi:MAG TPA: DUF1015 family protein [Actinophytocola sp.]|jgi:hypothetical protein|uniref:DUF1015 family protein n=1 Tax=Actinophytocola sp. TaxID=1872138 RepID=UPI002E085FA6|nr:DUF1015 family protein [Actinophytocola sp.]